MLHRFTIVCMAVSLSLVAVTASAVPFTSGDLYYAGNTSASPIYDITGGGNLTGITAFANGGNTGDRNLGQMAWSNDLETMYTTNYIGDSIFTVDAAGNSVFYASVRQPLGIVVTDDDRILVNSFSERRVYDITDTANIFVHATLPTYARNMRQIPSGEVLVAGSNGEVYDVSSGTAVVYAKIQGATASYLGDIEFTSDGRVFVTGGFGHRGDIFDITGGGMFMNNPWATVSSSNSGVAFGLAIDPQTNQMLLAPLGRNYVLDVTGGGFLNDNDMSIRWATNIPTTNDMALDFVPFVSVVPVAEPSSLVLLAIALLFASRRRSPRILQI